MATTDNTLIGQRNAVWSDESNAIVQSRLEESSCMCMLVLSSAQSLQLFCYFQRSSVSPSGEMLQFRRSSDSASSDQSMTGVLQLTGTDACSLVYCVILLWQSWNRRCQHCSKS